MPEYNSANPDIVDEIADLRRRLDALEKSNPFENATIGAGGITVTDSGNITILDGSGHVVWDALSGPLKIANVQIDDDSLTLPVDGTWHTYLVTNIPIPDGYTKAQVMVFASAGRTLSGATSGNVGAAALSIAQNGPFISNGVNNGGPVSASSYLSSYVSDLSGGLLVGMQAQSTGGTTAAGSDNIHLSATALFIR